MPHGMESMRPPGHMTREELGRHLDMKQSSKSQFMSIESAPQSLPDDIFSNDIYVAPNDTQITYILSDMFPSKKSMKS